MNRIAIILVASVLALSTAGAHHDGCTTEADATVETPVATYYVVSDDCVPHDCIFSLWIYQESNGHPGLQRGEDEVCTQDGCCGTWDADTILL